MALSLSEESLTSSGLFVHVSSLLQVKTGAELSMKLSISKFVVSAPDVTDVGMLKMTKLDLRRSFSSASATDSSTDIAMVAAAKDGDTVVT